MDININIFKLVLVGIADGLFLRLRDWDEDRRGKERKRERKGRGLFILWFYPFTDRSRFREPTKQYHNLSWVFHSFSINIHMLDYKSQGLNLEFANFFKDNFYFTFFFNLINCLSEIIIFFVHWSIL